MENSELRGSTAAGAATNAKPTVCFLGPVASYTHQATLDTFSEDKFDLIPVETIKDIFTTTQSGRADYGVVPFENSSNGSVVFTLDQFADRAGECPDVSVCAEIYLDVHHCLLGRVPSSQPQPSVSSSVAAAAAAPEVKPPLLHDVTRVKRVYSHPQAFGQCVKFLRTHLRGVETVDVSSTSRAAELARADPSGESAAVSSAAAARQLGLDVLARNIEDRDDNTTRFFVLRRGGGGGGWDDGGGDPEWLVERGRSREASHDAAATTREEEEEEEEPPKAPTYSRSKSLASFTVPHRHPGALADVLDCFRRARLNLTSINSRPSLAAPFRYVFFVEFEGHRRDDPEGRVRAVLDDVANVASTARWLGSWACMR
ncbi:PDT-domain-containing protein [Hypoxylon cercidicola]|nr:PDT-domain-containing protein [Hypoxylon cercidicola]